MKKVKKWSAQWVLLEWALFDLCSYIQQSSSSEDYFSTLLWYGTTARILSALCSSATTLNLISWCSVLGTERSSHPPGAKLLCPPSFTVLREASAVVGRRLEANPMSGWGLMWRKERRLMKRHPPLLSFTFLCHLCSPFSSSCNPFICSLDVP